MDRPSRRRFYTYIRLISPHFCEVAYLPQSYSGLTEPVDKHDTKLRDLCMRPASSGNFDCATLPRDAVSKIGVQNTAALRTVSHRILSQEPTLKLYLSAHDAATLPLARASVAKHHGALPSRGLAFNSEMSYTSRARSSAHLSSMVLG
jgi:hypothetical protein